MDSIDESYEQLPPQRTRWQRIIDPVYRFFAQRIWSTPAGQELPRRRFVDRASRVVALTVHGFVRDDSFHRAAALSFITVLSLVPLLAFLFSVAKEFGGYDSLIRHTVVPFLDNTFGPGHLEKGAADAQTVRQAIDKLLSYVSRTNVTSLGFFGLIFLLYAALQLLHEVEDSFNAIWQVHDHRPIMRKLANYVSVIAIAPIAILTATGITAAAQGSTSVRWLRETLMLGPFFKLVPVAMMAFGLVVVYRLMPNTRIHASSAFLGAGVAGLFWQVAQVLHLQSQISIARYNAIYASFAALPIFLVWIFISWVTVLIGAHLACAHQTEPAYTRPPWLIPQDHAFRERQTLRLVVLMARRFIRGSEPFSIAELAARLSLYDGAVRQLLQPLIDHRLIALTGMKGDTRVLLTRDLGGVRVKQLLDILKRPLRSMHEVPWRLDDAVQEILRGIDIEVASSAHNLTLRELALRTVERPNAPPEPRRRGANPREPETTHDAHRGPETRDAQANDPETRDAQPNPRETRDAQPDEQETRDAQPREPADDGPPAPAPPASQR